MPNQNFAARRVQAGVWVLRASQVAIRDDADIMSGRRKLRPRDEEGWRVPRPGAISAEIYACAKEGMRTVEIASAVGRKRSTVAVLSKLNILNGLSAKFLLRLRTTPRDFGKLRMTMAGLT